MTEPSLGETATAPASAEKDATRTPAAAASPPQQQQQQALPAAVEFEPPLACVRRILKNTLPASTNVGKDASAAFARSAGIFIIYLTACANDFARENRRQTITANDVLAAVKVRTVLYSYCMFVCVLYVWMVITVLLYVVDWMTKHAADDPNDFVVEEPQEGFQVLLLLSIHLFMMRLLNLSTAFYLLMVVSSLYNINSTVLHGRN